MRFLTSMDGLGEAGKYPVITYDGSLRIDHYPSNYPYKVAGVDVGYTTQDHVTTVDLAADPAYVAVPPAPTPAADPNAPAAAAAATPTVGQQAQANRDYVSSQMALSEIAKGPGYDFGRGSDRRRTYYREAGLGGNMQRLLDLDRPGLAFDLFGAIEEGAKAGYAKYAAAPKPASSGGPTLQIDNPFKGILPDWITKAQLPQSVRDVGGGIVSSVTKAATAKAPNAVVATTVYAPPAASSSRPNLLLWGGLAIAGIAAARVALKRK